MPRLVVNRPLTAAEHAQVATMLTIAKERFPSEASQVMEAKRWLENEFSVQAVLDRQREHARRIKEASDGQPELMRGHSAPARRPAHQAKVKPPQLSWELNRIQAAIESLSSANRGSERTRLLGAGQAVATRRTHAIRAVIVTSLVLDADAGEWLVDVTDLASVSWESDKHSGLGRITLAVKWESMAFELFVEALGVLGWNPDQGATAKVSPNSIHSSLDQLADQTAINRSVRSVHTPSNADSKNNPSDAQDPVRHALLGLRDAIRAAEAVLDSLVYGPGKWSELQARAIDEGFRACYNGEDCEGYIKRARQHAATVHRNRLFGSARDLCMEYSDLPSLPARTKNSERDLREALGNWGIDAMRGQAERTNQSALVATDQDPPPVFTSTKMTPSIDLHSSLSALSKRPAWAITELPPGINIATLRMLDDEGWIQARACYHEQSNPSRPTLQYLPWFSPMREPQSYPGGWEMVMKQHLEAKGRLPYEVQVSEKGLAELARGERAVPSAGSGGNQAHPTSASGDGDFRPASWFGKDLSARLRMAASPKRKSKRVATRRIDRVTCYSVADARRWWPSDIPKEP